MKLKDCRTSESIWNQVQSYQFRINDCIIYQVYAKVWEQVSTQVWDSVKDLAWSQFYVQVWDQVNEDLNYKV